jgi:hypothetical protein
LTYGFTRFLIAICVNDRRKKSIACCLLEYGWCISHPVLFNFCLDGKLNVNLCNFNNSYRYSPSVMSFWVINGTFKFFALNGVRGTPSEHSLSVPRTLICLQYSGVHGEFNCFLMFLLIVCSISEILSSGCERFTVFSVSFGNLSIKNIKTRLTSVTFEYKKVW